MNLSRRALIARVAIAGGYGAAYLLMQELGLAATPSASHTKFELPGIADNKTSVVILGAGIAGLTACYELERAGYKCTVLEASARAGGRNLTLRSNDRVEEIGSPIQNCQFDTDQYFNAGAARISSQHTTMLHYCKELGVKLEVFVNANRSGRYQDEDAFGGMPVASRQLYHDGAGYVAELLAKAIDKQALDEELSGIDRERLRYFLRHWGALDGRDQYAGSERSGYARKPGDAATPGQVLRPLGLEALVDSRFWHWQMFYEQQFDQQATMLQPVGGMDAIVKALEASLASPVRTGHRVTALHKQSAGVRVTYSREPNAEDAVVEADYCVCTLPFSILGQLKTDFSQQRASVIRLCGYEPSVKLAWQASRRFWEEDDSIYGGTSWSSDAITQLWYPSSGFHSTTGILVGAYNFGQQAIEFGRSTPADRARLARIGGVKLHAQIGSEVERPISIAWHRMPLSLGAFASWGRGVREQIFPLLTQPEDRIYLAGEHLSYLNGWQEGAVLSARLAVKRLHEEVLNRNNTVSTGQV